MRITGISLEMEDQWWEFRTDLLPGLDSPSACVVDGYITSWRCKLCEHPVCFEDMFEHLIKTHGVSDASR